MAFTSTGSDIAMKQNPKTGRWDFDWSTSGSNIGNPKYDNLQTHRVTTLLTSWRGKWAGDPSGARGSVLYLIKNDQSKTGSEIENAAKDALDPAVRQHFIEPAPTAYAQRIAPGSYRVLVRYTLPNGQAMAVTV